MVKDTEKVATPETKKTRKKNDSASSMETSPTTKVSTSSVASTTASTTTSTPVKRVLEGDLYKRVVDFEEAESLKRDPDQDIAIFEKTCQSIRQYMQEIIELKKIKTEESAAQILEKRVSASLLFVTLKKINRLEKFRTKQSRDILNRVKQQVDSYHLQLQNLLYETMHLQKEVTKCLEFKSKDEEIELVPVDVFYKDAPANIARKEETQNDPHKQKLARLEWELEQRKQLAAQCNEMLQSKETVAAEITKQTDYLDNICPQLQSLMKAMVPVQEQMGIYVDKIRKLHKTAGLLPAPLYVLFVQLEAYMNAADKHLTVTVEGDEDEAVALLSSGNKNEDPDDSDSDQEADPPEDLNEEKLRRHRKLSKVDRQEERRKRLLLKHPLHIHLTIKLKGFGDYLTLNFYYLMNLNVVTVQCEVHLVQQIRGISAGDLLSPHMLLAALIPNDLGEDSPNAANYYQLRNVGLDKFANYVSELGHPYRWTQQMAGLNFLPANQSTADGEQTDLVKPDPEVSRACVPDLVKCIRSRFKARIALGRQVQDFEGGHVQVLQSQKQAFPPRVSTTLTSWQPVIWNDYRQLNSTQRLVREKAVTEADTLYRAAFSRGSAKLIALIAVKPDHPKDPPVFSLNLHWNGEHNSNNDDAIRDMEREVNVHWRELVSEPGWSWGLLSSQMYRLMACLDVYLEATCTRSVLPVEFPKERIFFSPVRGRTRSLPYKYIPAGGGRYTQR